MNIARGIYSAHYSESVVDSVDHAHIQSEAILGRSHGNSNLLHGDVVRDGQYRRLVWSLVEREILIIAGNYIQGHTKI